MASSGSAAKHIVSGRCKCGLPVEVSIDLSPHTYGKMYEGCPLFSITNTHAGCGYFKWVEEDEIQWQKDAIQRLIAANSKLENAFLEAVSNTSFILERFTKGADENKKLRSKNAELTEKYTFCKCVKKFKFLVVMCYAALLGCLSLCIGKSFW